MIYTCATRLSYFERGEGTDERYSFWASCTWVWGTLTEDLCCRFLETYWDGTLSDSPFISCDARDIQYNIWNCVTITSTPNKYDHLEVQQVIDRRRGVVNYYRQDLVIRYFAVDSNMRRYNKFQQQQQRQQQPFIINIGDITTTTTTTTTTMWTPSMWSSTM